MWAFQPVTGRSGAEDRKNRTRGNISRLKKVLLVMGVLNSWSATQGNEMIIIN